jgi:hypothetical protein
MGILICIAGASLAAGNDMYGWATFMALCAICGAIGESS